MPSGSSSTGDHAPAEITTASAGNASSAVRTPVTRPPATSRPAPPRPLVVEEVDHSAARAELEVVDLRQQLVVAGASRERELELRPLRARVGPQVADVAARRSIGRALAFEQGDAGAAERELVGGCGA